MHSCVFLLYFQAAKDRNFERNELMSSSYHGDENDDDKKTFNTHILAELKSLAIGSLKKSTINALIAIPAFYDSFQRNTVISSGIKAGFGDVHLINETSAVAGLYKQRNHSKREKLILIVSFGAGHLEASLFKQKGRSIECLVAKSNPNIGGIDFDNVIYNICKMEIADNITDKRAIQRLRLQAEKAKRILSTGPRAQIQVDLGKKSDFITQIKRET